MLHESSTSVEPLLGLPGSLLNRLAPLHRTKPSLDCPGQFLNRPGAFLDHARSPFDCSGPVLVRIGPFWT